MHLKYRQWLSMLNYNSYGGYRIHRNPKAFTYPLQCCLISANASQFAVRICSIPILCDILSFSFIILHYFSLSMNLQLKFYQMLTSLFFQGYYVGEDASSLFANKSRDLVVNFVVKATEAEGEDLNCGISFII